ncbi:hypothetical protein M2347_003835 [Chryseobacterium sp. H1D6B]|uniref:hypothetical protein n=1 Tax=Chryseobacterium sp. H1D6B TaxID=2940588 RepID=UPI0015CC1978|nr:hypothetical protein [Chryseobacterium sp. H1D6B]MDH6254108.1 hypothetical protein [Chryseobacterium sp. H1D6B]
MKNQNLEKGKKLSKRELRTITGGLLNCMEATPCPSLPCEPSGYPNGCTKISVSCAQKVCRPGIEIIS